MSASRARVKANNKWNKKAYDAITFRMKKGEKEVISEHVKSTGESINSFIIRAIITQIELDKQNAGSHDNHDDIETQTELLTTELYELTENTN